MASLEAHENQFIHPQVMRDIEIGGSSASGEQPQNHHHHHHCNGGNDASQPSLARDASSTSSPDSLSPSSHRPLEEQGTHQQEEDVVESLDRGIAHMEEQQLMETLDRQITQHEEQDLMQSLLENIHGTAEATERAPSLPPTAKSDEWRKLGSGVQEQHPGSIPNSWKIQKRNRKRRRGQGPTAHSVNTTHRNQSSIHETSFSKVNGVGDVDIKKVRQALPKWAPTASSSEPQRLFTRSEFVTGVILKVRKEIPPEMVYSNMWNVGIMEEDPADPNSYFLEASGPREYLDILRNKTETFVQEYIAYHNRQELLNDDESFVVDVSMCLSAGPLMVRLIVDPVAAEPSEGAWIKSFKPASGLGQLLGGNDAYGKGCVLLSINAIEVWHASQAPKVFSQAKAREGSNGGIIGGKSKLTLCLSKHADFRHSSDPSALSIRRIGDKTENVLEKFMRENPPSPCWLERASKGDERKLTSNFPSHMPRSKNDSSDFYNRIMKDKRSVEVDLVLSNTEGDIGARIVTIPKTGLFLRSISPTKQIGKLLGGSAYVFGAVLWKVNGEKVWSKEDFYAVTEEDTNFAATLILFDGLDLSNICRERLVRHRCNPHRRNGQPYPLFQPAGSTLDVHSLEMSTLALGDATRIPKKKRKIQVLDNDNSDSDDPVRGASSGTHSGSGGGFERFKQFDNKFKRLIREDFKDTKIHLKHVLSSLWEKHKQQFGSTSACDDNCQCLHSLPKLASNLVSHHLLKHKKSQRTLQDEHEMGKRVAGIMEFFAPVFIPKLEEAYPNESPAQLLARLCDMWSVHTRVPMYGLRCSEKCECHGEWDGLFANGNASKMNKRWTSRASGNKRPAPVTQQAARSGGALIPRKRPAKNPASVMSLAAHSAALPPSWISDSGPYHPSANQGSGNGPVSRRGSLAQGPKRASAYQQGPFEVVLDSSQPLGGYFTTDDVPNGYANVEIKSICPRGQLQTDKRISRGTRVQNLLTGETRRLVGSHTELMNYFEFAKRQKRPLKLIMVTQGAMPGTRQNESDWNSSGEWTGNLEGGKAGWAGGALDHNSEQAQQQPSTKPAENLTVADQAKNAPATEEIQIENSQWTSSTSERHLPGPDHRPSKSSLKGDKKKPKKSSVKRVKISDSDKKVVIFDRDHPSNVQVVEKVVESFEPVPPEPELSEEEKLFEAIQSGSGKDLIDILQSGLISSPSIVKTALTPNYNYLKERKAEVSRSIDNGTVTEEMQQLEAKALVMKIFTNATFLTAKAMSLTSFFELKINVVALSMEAAVNATKPIPGSSVCRGQVVVTYGDDKAYREVLGQLPVRPFAKQISYDDKCSFTTHNNSAFGMEDRRLVIEVEQKSLISTNPPTRLGRAIFEMDDLEQRCISGGDFLEVAMPMSTQGGPLSHGEATIVVQKTRVTGEYINSKRKEVLRGLRVQIENIKKFNQKWSRFCGEPLNGNIQGIDGLTLLHAAVHLGETPLVEELLKLGADPKQRSRFGTPLHFAQQMLERVLEKEKNLEAKNAPEEERLSQSKKCEQAKKLVGALMNEAQAERVEADSGITVASGGASTSTTATVNSSRVVVVADESSQRSHSQPWNGGHATGPPRPMSARSLLESNAAGSARPRPRSGTDSHPNFQPNLPLLPSAAWIKGPILRVDPCSKNFQNCWHFENGKCKFWHDILDPLRPHDLCITPCRVLPLDPKRVFLKEYGPFWTAAYAYGNRQKKNRRILHAQDPFRKGYCSEQGIWWFHKRSDAEDALEQTVAILMQLEESRPPPDQGRSRSHSRSRSRSLSPNPCLQSAIRNP